MSEENKYDNYPNSKEFIDTCDQRQRNFVTESRPARLLDADSHEIAILRVWEEEPKNLDYIADIEDQPSLDNLQAHQATYLEVWVHPSKKRYRVVKQRVCHNIKPHVHVDVERLNQ